MSPEQIAAKQAAAAATQTIAAAQNAAASNKNTVSHQQLVHSCKVKSCTGFTDGYNQNQNPFIVIAQVYNEILAASVYFA